MPSNNPSSVFSVFDLPVSERLAALRVYLDAGTDPNSVDNATHLGESLLGRVLSHDKDAVDITLLHELMERGANPFPPQMRRASTGRIGPTLQSLALNALDSFTPIDPQVTAELLSGCLKHDHRNRRGQDVLRFLVEASHSVDGLYSPAIRQAIEMGFPLNQPFDKHPNAVHHLIAEFTRRVENPLARPFEGVWDDVLIFVEAGVDMYHLDATGSTGWDIVDAWEGSFGAHPVYRSVLAHRQAATLESDTAPATGSRAPSAACSEFSLLLTTNPPRQM